MNIVIGLFLAVIITKSFDRIMEEHYCKKNYKKKAQCTCWTCRFYNDCEFTKIYNKKKEENYESKNNSSI